MKAPKITIAYLASQGLAANFPSRFWKFVKKRGPNECWICTATTPNGRYPHLKTGVDGKSIQASRAAYILCKGPIPKGKIVRHNCTPTRDFPACCNPAQYGVNAVTIFRYLHGIRYGNSKFTTKKSLRSRYTKITNKQADEIRKIYAAGGISMKKLGEKFGICAPHVFDIVHRNKRA